MTNWGEAFLSHYEKFLTPLIGRSIHKGLTGEAHSIQVLSYDGVFRGCRVFGTLGMSHYAEELGGRFEVVLAVDDGWEDAGGILANTVFRMIQLRMEFGRGIAIGGVPKIAPEFVRNFQKVAVYFTTPTAFPAAFHQVSGDGLPGEILMGMFISKAEYDFFLDQGAQKFEAMLQARGVDPFGVRRPSAV